MEKIYDIFGIGNPVVDILAKIEDTFIEKLSLRKGSMHLISRERREDILKEIASIPKNIVPGGSCANTMFALSDLGLNVVYSGAISSDEYGNAFQKSTEKFGITGNLSLKESPTASSIILITEDTERTMNTYLGACREYDSSDVDIEKLKQSRFLYFTGYMWDTESQKEALKKAIKIAKENDVKIIFDVADPFAVSNSREDFLKIIKEDADFFFANEEEAKMLSGKNTSDDAIEFLMLNAKAGAIKLGSNGSVIFSGNQRFDIDIFKVDAVDTTGAGDMYAAGVIFGIAKSLGFEKAGKIASFSSAEVVKNIGARLDYSLKKKVLDL
ncbi:MAG: adenosine kinase [Candidatus Woesearchaeota archaeon]